MSKCLVSWCPDEGLERGALPGLCIQHRDQTLAKQREAVEVVQSVPNSPDVWTSTDRVSRFDGACGVSGCTKAGIRGPDGRVLCETHRAEDRAGSGSEMAARRSADVRVLAS